MNTATSGNTSVNTNTARFGSGKEVRRLEDELLLKGQGQFTDDVAPADQAHLLFLRSPYPHANIKSINAKAALAMPGVLYIVTGADLVKAGVNPIPGVAGFPRADGSAARSATRYALAHERVRYVGEQVAAIVAQTLDQARDAAEAIVVDYEELPMAVHLNDATAAGAPLLCEELGDNIAAEMRHGDATATAAAFASAKHVVKLALTNQRVAAVALEPRTVLDTFEASTGRLTVRMSTQRASR